MSSTNVYNKKRKKIKQSQWKVMFSWCQLLSLLWQKSFLFISNFHLLSSQLVQMSFILTDSLMQICSQHLALVKIYSQLLFNIFVFIAFYFPINSWHLISLTTLNPNIYFIFNHIKCTFFVLNNNKVKTKTSSKSQPLSYILIAEYTRLTTVNIKKSISSTPQLWTL